LSLGEIKSKFSLRHIFGVKDLIDENEWQEHRSLAYRTTNMLKILIASMYGQEVEDTDKDPAELADQHQPEFTQKQEEDALKKLLASRQTKEHEIESFEKLRRSLQHQQEERAKQQRS